MNIAILGTGNMAAGLSEVFASAGHQVTIGGRDQDKANALAAKIGHDAKSADIATAARSADVVALAVPYEALQGVADAAGQLAGKVIIDLSNPVTADYHGLQVGLTSSAAEELQRHLPQAKVVKAFNAVFAGLLPKEARSGKNLQIFIASDHTDAKDVVSKLAGSAGFEAVDSGDLRNSRFLEPIGGMNIQFRFFLGKGSTISPAWVTY